MLGLLLGLGGSGALWYIELDGKYRGSEECEKWQSRQFMTKFNTFQAV